MGIEEDPVRMDQDPYQVEAHGVTAAVSLGDEGTDQWILIGFKCDGEDFNFMLPWEGAELLAQDITAEMEQEEK